MSDKRIDQAFDHLKSCCLLLEEIAKDESVDIAVRNVCKVCASMTRTIARKVAGLVNQGDIMIADKILKGPVNLVHYNVSTKKLEIYMNLEARIVITKYKSGYSTGTIFFRVQPSKKEKKFQVAPEENQIYMGKRSYTIWSTDPIDINHFIDEVWNSRLEHYGHMVSDALALIKKQRDSLDADRIALFEGY